MKKILSMLAIAAIMTSFVACDDDEKTIFEAPAFTLSTTNSAVKVGGTATITVNVSAAKGKIATITGEVISGGGTVTIDATSLVDQTTGSVEATFTAPATSGTSVIEFTVTDKQNPALSVDETIAITVTEQDPPAVTFPAATVTANIGSAATSTVTLAAEAGLSKLVVKKGDVILDEVTLTGTTDTYEFSYMVDPREIVASFPVQFILTDANDAEQNATLTINTNGLTILGQDRLNAYFDYAGNKVVDPVFAASSIKPTAADVTSGVYDLSSVASFFATVNYKGAVDPAATTTWYDGWSFYSNVIATGTDVDVDRSSLLTGKPVVDVTDTDLNADGSADATNLTAVTWTKDKVWVLNGFVYVESGQTLTIEAGTVVKAKPGSGASASALIIARGGRINAVGTASEPIIFTNEADPLNGSQRATFRGQWGGVILLGRSANNTAAATQNIEGIPTTEPRGTFGGNDAADNSGTMKYVSIRHGGSVIGANNEINGLTLGGVGTGTVIEYIEVVGNADDGYEWFGGTVNGKYLISLFNDDDGIDYDMGYRGMNQFVIVHQDFTDPAGAKGNRGCECDGGTNPETGTPYAEPVFANMTMVGRNGGTENQSWFINDNAGAYLYNSIITNFAHHFQIEELATDDIGLTVEDSFNQFLSGRLEIRSNIFHNVPTTNGVLDYL